MRLVSCVLGLALCCVGDSHILMQLPECVQKAIVESWKRQADGQQTATQKRKQKREKGLKRKWSSGSNMLMSLQEAGSAEDGEESYQE
jgi:hypothetical protein